MLSLLTISMIMMIPAAAVLACSVVIRFFEKKLNTSNRISVCDI
ncbi:hypothetical protein [Thalassotalea hakodatensis]|nr:hypothetical protein [Thalassotalea hakodatensis]